MLSEVLFISVLVILGMSLFFGPVILASRAILGPIATRSAMQRWQMPMTVGIEAGILLSVVVLGLASGFPAALLAAAVALTALLAVMDAKWRWLPGEWTLALIAIGLILAFRDGRLAEAALAAGISSLGLFALQLGYRTIRGVEGLGTGDIWLIAGFSTFLEPRLIPLLIGLAALSGLAQELVQRAVPGASGRTRFGVAFGTHLSLVFVILLFFQPF